MNISITGNLGSGKSSVAKLLRGKGYEIFSTGNVFRQLAMEQGVSVEEFNRRVNEAAARGDRSVDKMIDDATTKMGEENDNIVFDSRLAWHFVPKSFKVFVITDIDESSRRVFNDSVRASSEAYKTMEECKRALIHRQKLETVRYKEIYGIDYYDMSNYNLVIESTLASPEELADEILLRLEQYGQGAFEKLMELNPSSIKISENNAEENAECVAVSEKGGAFTLAAGKEKLLRALGESLKFIPVTVAKTEDGGEDSFMNFSEMSKG